ncbi:uncharacterized protein LOC143677442 isoform X4 [Tamandua tetradactyla]|uniref:uncharacterized protein LOC143677442 isoform X4 n=1 Tax=Tamandua tetradactyla TaxID=48850 RepID=UPI0040542906
MAMRKGSRKDVGGRSTRSEQLLPIFTPMETAQKDVSSGGARRAAPRTPGTHATARSSATLSTIRAKRSWKLWAPRWLQKLLPMSSLDQDPRAPTYVGLINQGLTCYLNALLQCLFLTPEFLDKIQESPKSSELEQALNQIFCRLAEQRGAVPTQALTACLNLGYGQRDVGDVFLYLLQSLGREDLQEVFQSEVEKVIRCSVCDVEDYIPSGGRMLLLPLASHAQLCGLGEEQVPQEPTQESAGLSQVPGPSPDGQGGCPSAERAGRGFTLPPLPPSFHLCWAQMPLLSEHCRQVGNGHLGCLGLDWPWAGVLGTQSRCPWGRAPGCHSDLEGAGYPPRTRAQGGAVGARSRACCRQGFPWQQNRWAKGQWCRLGKTLGKSVEHRGGAVEEQVAGGGPQGREVESGGAQGLPCLAKT